VDRTDGIVILRIEEIGLPSSGSGFKVNGAVIGDSDFGRVSDMPQNLDRGWILNRISPKPQYVNHPKTTESRVS
jgi:hypothetical protein